MPSTNVKQFPIEISSSDSDKGRCFLATRDIEPNQLLFETTPYASVPDCENISKICAHCHLPQQLKCKKCNLVSYCSEQCLLKDSSIHQLECEFVSNVLMKLDWNQYTKDYAWLLTRCLIKKYLQEEKKVQFPADEMTFENVWQLCSNQSLFPKEKLKEFLKVSKVLTDFWIQLNDCKSICSSKTICQEEIEKEILSLICKEECNSFGLYHFPSQNEPKQCYALSLFPQAVYFNHDCYPNVLHQTVLEDGKIKQRFYSQRKIEKGQELCISYLNIRDSFDKRNQELKKVFLFDCQCKRCQNKDSDSELEKKVREMFCIDEKCFGYYLPTKDGLKCECCAQYQ